MRLGDLIEKITKITGIKWIVKKIWGDDCGCDKRKDKANKVKLWQKKTEKNGRSFLIEKTKANLIEQK